MRTSFIVLVLSLCLGCATIEKAAPSLAKATVVAASAGAGGMFGPLEAFLGAVLGWLGIELWDTEVELDETKVKAEVDEARARQEEKDFSSQQLALLMDNPDAAKWFREKATEAAIAKTDSLRDKVEFWACIAGLVYVLKQLYSSKKAKRLALEFRKEIDERFNGS